MVGLIGTGQAIHVGEEGGIDLWRDALGNFARGAEWTVHAPQKFRSLFSQAGVSFVGNDALNLDTELRFHQAPKLDEFVEGLVSGRDPAELHAIADELHSNGFRCLITRDLEEAKAYVRQRYANAPETRYAILASSKDKWLERFGIDNSFQTTKKLKVASWYNQPQENPLSCSEEVLVPIAQQCIVAAKMLCAPDLERELRASTGWVNGRLSSNGIAW